MNPIVLGGVLKNFYSEFDISSFDDRLRLQKIIYLMKAKEISLGYTFGLYLYGPYCKELCRDAYQVNDLVNLDSINPMVPEDAELKSRFLEFKGQIEKNKNDTKWLEIVASLIFIKRNGLAKDERETIRLILSKRENMTLTEEDIKEVIKEIRGGYFYD
jgi:uncharacterized protein YwgA